eukprot:TRINITY_DN513_c0_g1_i1.p1 TRINITY_DN513_c0_g1~~TRINITY_DN513_c0_g1_i1.p1  ORF type:complete len:400 (+),score=72.94 TRINITY_DN513_c0_g1_i1:38-1237(+)
MANKFVVILLLALCVSQIFAVSLPDKKKIREQVNGIRDKVKHIGQKMAQDLPTIPNFNCVPVTNVPPATSVNQLHPANVKVLMAAGDSITAGFAMRSTNFNILKIKQNLVEYRPYVFSIGANNSHTLFNYFQVYNPALVGGSVGYSYPIADKHDYMQIVVPPPGESVLNAGESGAIVSDIKQQVDYLVAQLNNLESQGKLSVANDFKVLTLLIGANNLCVACVDPEKGSPDNYEANLRDALVYAKQKIPRLLVSIVTLFNLSTVYNTFQTSSYCVNIRKNVFNKECACIAKDYTPERLAQVDEYGQIYNQRIFKVASEFQNDDSFTVKVQPCTQDFVIPQSIGTQFLSQYDCFHPSLFANEAISVALWNNMITAPSEKKTTFNPLQEDFVCPTANTILQ